MRQYVRSLGLTLFVLLISSLTLASLCVAEDGAAADQPIRVGLVRTLRNVKQVTLLASCDYVVTRTGSKERLAGCTNLEPVTIDAAQSALSIKLVNGSVLDGGTSVTIAAVSGKGMLSVDSPGKPGKQYRGAIEVSLRSGYLQLVSIVDIEDYLPGVVTGEMPSSYPDEALKAQAVAARTYTLCALHRHSSSGYDLCDDAHCQCYDGVLRERPSVTRAVLETKGQVLTYKGRLASVMYCADCGGVTECYAEAHNGDIPYLPSVTEPAGIRHAEWERSYKLSELSTKLMAAGVKEAEAMDKIAIRKSSSSGRVLLFEVSGPKGTATFSGLKMRAALGRDGIRSTLCTIDTSADGVVTFKGRGWGHGIGLCQVGAGALAAPPYNYSYGQILAHYYPGTSLSPLPAPINKAETPAKSTVAPQDSGQKPAQALGQGKSNPEEIQLRVETPKL